MQRTAVHGTTELTCCSRPLAGARERLVCSTALCSPAVATNRLVTTARYVDACMQSPRQSFRMSAAAGFKGRKVKVCVSPATGDRTAGLIGVEVSGGSALRQEFRSAICSMRSSCTKCTR
jgi:hypothetical protein